ncbi:hypothetical protein HNP33_000333 [Comamonas odontotermitis]|uniref:Uncharacterized protein n=1 Tax=Comamonas odontotermitis TaxID=379895 RepID=A0ABR6RAV6_9BURK|nr:hypothetical protein [Comamonas odontotermitis]MBB6576285.1 hypothetical protein [Comamonas odontotermitis]
MSPGSRSWRSWYGSAAAALAFALLAWALRSSGSYPICHNDEVNWVSIAHQLDAGVHWPVSGPAFIHTVRALSEQLQFSHTQSISMVGIGGVFVSMLLLLWGYRKLALAGSAAILAGLALSSYFWAPLMESRPQQWGQMLVFLGVICAWLWLHRQGGWAFFLIVPCIAVTHILSHAILVFLCGMLVIADFLEKRPLTWRHFSLLLVVVASMGVYAWPHGPYAAMLADLEQVQMQRLLQAGPYLAALPLVAGMALMGVQRKWHWRPSWTEAVATGLERRRTATGLGLLCIVFTALAIQAYLLPAQAWLPYGGSMLRFLAFQLGNVMFAVFFVVGIYGLIDGLHAKRYNPLMGRLLIWVLIAFATLALLSIAASWWLLDTNWFLRVLNYGIFFAAIVTAIGIANATKTWPRVAMYTLLGVGMVASILAVVRPPQLLGC